MNRSRLVGRGARSALAWSLVVLVIFAVPSPEATSNESGPWWFPTQGPWLETQNLEADDEDEPRHFGSHLAIDGNTMIVSTQHDMYNDQYLSCPDFDGCDRVYVFERQGGAEWEQTDVLIPDDARPGDTFGFSLDVDEESGVIVVGNPSVKAKADQIYIFERQEDHSWSQTAMFKRDYPDLPEDHWTLFGLSVAVSGHTALTTDIAQSTPGRSFVFEKVEGAWQETAELLGGLGPHGLALSGDVAVTTELSRDEFCEGVSWKVYHIIVHERIDGEWVQKARLFPEPSDDNTQTGVHRIALSDDGKTIVAAAAVDRRVYGVHTEHCVYLEAPEPLGPQRIHTSSGLAGAVGSAWVYEEIDGEWQMTADIPNPLPNPGPLTGGSTFGVAVDVSGTTAVIGAAGDFYNAGVWSGTAYVYEKILGEWVLEGRFRTHDASEADRFAETVGVSGSTIVVGAFWAGENGKTYVFDHAQEEVSSKFSLL